MTIDLFTPDTVAPDHFGSDTAAAGRPRRASPARAVARPAGRATPIAPPTPQQQVGFQLGWDHAHHAITPAAPHALEASPVHQGWLAGQAVFGPRTLADTAPVRQWLALRLHAWQQQRHVELMHITPAYLRQLAVTHCPITRDALDAAGQPHTAAVFDAVRSDAAFAAGNLAVLGARAQHAKAAHRFSDALHIARTLDAERTRGSATRTALGADGLTAAQWGRVAVLCSFVEALPHAQACTLPLLVLPPNRLRLLNPVQALQALVSRQLLDAGWSTRINALEALLVGAPARRAFRSFFQTWLPRVIEAGARTAGTRQPAQPQAARHDGQPTRQPGRQHARWALEDAWRHAAVMQRWERFALLLNPAQCESLVARAVAAGLTPRGMRIEPLAHARATDGWCLDRQGAAAHAHAHAHPHPHPHPHPLSPPLPHTQVDQPTARLTGVAARDAAEAPCHQSAVSARLLH